MKKNRDPEIETYILFTVGENKSRLVNAPQTVS